MPGGNGASVSKTKDLVKTLPLFEVQLSTIVHRRRARSLLRTTPWPPSPPLTDFSSNDYLGLSRNRALQQRFVGTLSSVAHSIGSTGSRLLNGNSAYALSLERYLASFHHAPAALLFNSGYDANVSLLSCLPQPDGAVIFDEYVHASMHDGIKLGRAKCARRFRHNDVEHLREILTELLTSVGDQPPICSTAVVAIEALYSMDGDVAPLEQIITVIEQFDGRAILIVDEAHSTGSYGPQGRGLLCALNLEQRVFARLHTFGKAVGAHGAVVLGSPLLRDYLVNYARPLVYSTMMSYHGLIAVKCAYEHLAQQADQLQQKLWDLVNIFRSRVGTLDQDVSLLPAKSMIQGVVIPGKYCLQAYQVGWH